MTQVAGTPAWVIFSAQGQLPVGTGAYSGKLLTTGTANQVLAVGGNDPSGLQWISPSASVEAGFTAKGDLYVGTGSGTGAILPVGATNGFVLAVASGAADGVQWQYPALTSAAGHLAADYTVTTSMATFLTTASLAVGKWLVHLGASVESGTSLSNAELKVVVGTATATFEGKTAGELVDPAAVTFEGDVVLDFIATVTVAGTLVFQAQYATTAGTIIKAATVTNAVGNATGYTAVRIA